jgi:hypothetical protein
METLQGKDTSQNEIMMRLQSQMGENKAPDSIQDKLKGARNNALPFERKNQPASEKSNSTEIPQAFYDIGEKIVKAPFEIAKNIPDTIFKSTRPALAQGDDTFESLALNWKAKVKGFFSGIGSFFKSAFNSKSDKK